MFNKPDGSVTGQPARRRNNDAALLDEIAVAQHGRNSALMAF
jgi:hypothetical protein